MTKTTCAIAAVRCSSARQHSAFAVALAALVFVLTAPAHAAELTELRGLASIKKVEGATLFAAEFRVGGPSPLWPNRLQASVGVVSRADDNRPFLGLGRVWRWQDSRRAAYAEPGISPTLLRGDRLGNRDLGGVPFFSTALSAGCRFDNGWDFALRLQHISNAGLNEINPGADLVGIGLVRELSFQQR